MQENIINFLSEKGIDILLIFLLIFLGKLILKIIVRRIRKLVDDGDDENLSQKERRAEAIGQVIISIGNVFIYVTVIIMVLNLFGIDIRPILAGVGVAGLTIGFGAQSIVKDFVAGLFILLENQYGVGDKVLISKFEGRVAKITMRSTVLKNEEGEVFYISNGLIKEAINKSQAKLFK